MVFQVIFSNWKAALMRWLSWPLKNTNFHLHCIYTNIIFEKIVIKLVLPPSQPIAPSATGSPSGASRFLAGPPWAGPPDSAGTPSSSSSTDRLTHGSLSFSAVASTPSSGGARFLKETIAITSICLCPHRETYVSKYLKFTTRKNWLHTEDGY